MGAKLLRLRYRIDMKILKYFQNKPKELAAAVFLLGCLFCCLPQKAAAAEFYFSRQPDEVRVGDTFAVDLKISSPEESVNVLEGYLTFDKEKLTLEEISAGGSLFEFWLKQQIFSDKEGDISFIGGVAGGFLGKEAVILKIIFNAKKEGTVFLHLKDNSVLFLNDGRGTPVNFISRPIFLNIAASSEAVLPRDEWRALLNEDRVPPEPFEVTRGKDRTIFDNRYFISFLPMTNIQA